VCVKAIFSAAKIANYSTQANKISEFFGEKASHQLPLSSRWTIFADATTKNDLSTMKNISNQWYKILGALCLFLLIVMLYRREARISSRIDSLEARLTAIEVYAQGRNSRPMGQPPSTTRVDATNDAPASGNIAQKSRSERKFFRLFPFFSVSSAVEKHRPRKFFVFFRAFRGYKKIAIVLLVFF